MPKKNKDQRKTQGFEAFGEEIHSSNLEELTATLERKVQDKHRETQGIMMPHTPHGFPRR